MIFVLRILSVNFKMFVSFVDIIFHIHVFECSFQCLMLKMKYMTLAVP